MVSAPGNLFFAGEHAVVYGRPAIVTSVDRRTKVTIKPRDDDMVIVNSRGFGIAEMRVNGENKSGPEELGIVLEFVDSLVTKSQIEKGFEVHIESDVPVESGMSSSTALFASLLEALNNYLGLGFTRKDYFDYILPFQEKVHGGKASGSEIYSSVFGGFHWLEKKGEKLVGEMLGNFPVPVVIGNTKVRAPTKLTVGYHVPSLASRYPNLVENAWDEIAEIANEARKAIKNQCLEDLGTLMTRNHLVLKGLGLSHPKLEDCISEAMKAGALGAKLSGGGWGGIMFAITYPENQDKVARALERTGVQVIKTRIGVPGIMD